MTNIGIKFANSKLKNIVTVTAFKGRYVSVESHCSNVRIKRAIIWPEKEWLNSVKVIFTKTQKEIAKYNNAYHQVI